MDNPSFAEASPPPPPSPSSSALPAAIDSLVPRGLSKAWKQAKSRAEVSMALLQIVATSPVVGLLPALLPPSPRSPSSALLLLHRSRVAAASPAQRSSSKAASVSSPSPSASSASAVAAVASPSSSSAFAAAVASPSTPSRSPSIAKLVSEPESRASEASQCGRPGRRPPCSTPCASSPFASVKTTHKIYLCTAWMFIWLWRLLRACYNCLSGKQRGSASPSAAAVTATAASTAKELAQAARTAAASSSPRPTNPRSSKDLCAIAHNINSSSKHLKRKLRSSFKTLSVQVPRKAFAPLNHHFARLSPSSSGAAIYSSSSPAPAPPSPAPALNPCKSSPLLSPCGASSPFNLRSGTPSTAHSPAINKLPARDCSNASDAFYYDTAPLSCSSTSARSSLSSCNSDHSNSSNTASSLPPSSDPISIDEKPHQSAALSLDSLHAIPSASTGSGIIAFFTVCLALGGLIFGKLVAAIAVIGCWLLLRGRITSTKRP